MKKIISVVAALMLCAVAAVSASAASPLTFGPGPVVLSPGMPTYEEMTGTVGGDGIATPFVDCENMPEACLKAGFFMSAPSDIAGYPYRHISVIPGELIQVEYSGCFNAFTLRKSKTIEGERTLTGDYNDYPESKTLDLNGRSVKVNGKNGIINNAYWTIGNHSYAVYAGVGIDENTLSQIVAKTL